MDKIVFISDEEKRVIFQKASFQYFLHKNSLILERCLQLEDKHNVMKDYTEDNQEKDRQQKENLATLQEFFFESRTKNRSVTDIDWSPHVINY